MESTYVILGPILKLTLSYFFLITPSVIVFVSVVPWTMSVLFYYNGYFYFLKSKFFLCLYYGLLCFKHWLSDKIKAHQTIFYQLAEIGSSFFPVGRFSIPILEKIVCVCVCIRVSNFVCHFCDLFVVTSVIIEV